MKQTGRKFVTSQHLMLAVDGTQKEFHMNSVSNSTPTEVSQILLYMFLNQLRDKG